MNYAHTMEQYVADRAPHLAPAQMLEEFENSD